MLRFWFLNAGMPGAFSSRRPTVTLAKSTRSAIVADVKGACKFYRLPNELHLFVRGAPFQIGHQGVPLVVPKRRYRAYHHGYRAGGRLICICKRAESDGANIRPQPPPGPDLPGRGPASRSGAGRAGPVPGRSGARPPHDVAAPAPAPHLRGRKGAPSVASFAGYVAERRRGVLREAPAPPPGAASLDRVAGSGLDRGGRHPPSFTARRVSVPPYREPDPRGAVAGVSTKRGWPLASWPPAFAAARPRGKGDA